ncbi:MAG: hypothetical protein ACRDTQ_00300 [Micromonosporaceae bacterium]
MTSNAGDSAVMSPGSATAEPSPIGSLRQRWPALAGLGFAAAVAFGMTSGVEMAAVLAAAAIVYLGAAAWGTPRAAWPMFFATAVVITAVKIVDNQFDPTWVLLGSGVLLLAYGLLRGALRPRHGLPLQTLAWLGFGAVAAIGLIVNPVLGSYLVALGLLVHAGWDLHHHRTSRVVARSMAEFCLALDATLAVVIVVVTAAA